MKKYNRKKLDILMLSAIVLIVLSLTLMVLLALFKIPRLQNWYESYLVYLSQIEFKIASFESKWIIIISIYFLFALKSLIPIPFLPLSCVCVISGMVFKTPTSLIINLSGIVMIFAIRYYIGVKRKTVPYKILKSYDEIWKVLEHDGNGNPWLLFACRFIPLFPINTVSNIYGSMNYEFRNYLLISAFGFLPKIISYSIIGRNAFNPFSASFIIPITLLCFFSGMGLLLTRKVILIIKKGEFDVKRKN